MAGVALFALEDEDYNGQLFVTGMAGYQEIVDDLDVFWLPDVVPAGFAYPFTGTDLVRREMLNIVYTLNYHMLIDNGTYYVGKEQEARVIAYFRVLIFRAGLVDPTIAPITKHCKYNLARRLGAPLESVVVRNWAAKHAEAIAGYNDAHGNPVAGVPVPTVAQVMATVTAPQYAQNIGCPANTRRYLMDNFADIICLVAYFFRIRGHHWQQDFDVRYKDIFKGCNRSLQQNEPGVPWERMARNACKVIFPIDLDNFWQSRVNENQCSGSIALRLDSAAAGTAALFALKMGADDLIAAMPALALRFEQHLRRLNDAVNFHRDNRYAGSINHNFYGVAQRTYDERGYGAIASIVQGAITQFCETAALGKSKALQRLASQAPITGGVVGAVMAGAVKSTAMIDQYLMQ